MINTGIEMGIRPVAAMLAVLSATATAGGPREYHGVIHVHSRLSHDSRGTFPAIAAAARANHLDFVILTDHPGGGAPELQPNGMLGGVLFIPGVETHHLLALGVTRALTATTTAGLVGEVHRQGGLAIASHPASFSNWDAPGLDGMEIYDIADDVRDGFLPFTVARWLWAYLRDPVLAMTAFLDYPAVNLHRWDAESARRSFIGLAGNDAHDNVRVLGWRLDPYARQFAMVQTWVTTGSLDTQAILEGLRAGRSRVVYAMFGVPGPALLTAAGPGRCRIRGPAAAEARLLADGKDAAVIPAAARPFDVTVNAPPAAVLRLELWKDAGGTRVPWVLASPLRLQPGRRGRTARNQKQTRMPPA